MKPMTLLRAGLLTASSDFAFATVLTIFFFNGTFMRLWQGVASVPLGRQALEGGVRTMWIGLGLHVCVAFWWSGVFLFGVLRLKAITRMLLSRLGSLKVALLYGPFVWLAMTLVVIPLFTKRPPSFALRWWIQLVGHVPFVALPITWTARNATDWMLRDKIGTVDATVPTPLRGAE
jgi:hypothetical protein